jgi:sugar lactone lactonase YvrE
VLRRSAAGAVTEHADVSAITGGHLNDMIVDRDGRAYAGNFGFDLMGGGEPAVASLVRVDPDGTATVAAEDLWFPNGIVITDDGTLIVAETFAARFTAFRVAGDGTLTDRRVWAQVEPSPEPADTHGMLGAVTFAPDGCALDAEGHVWAANALGGVVCRVAPGGRIVEEIAIPNGSGCSPAGSAPRTAARSSPAPPRTSTRRHARRRARRCC